MRKLVTVGLISVLLASIVVASATAALPKPKPWHWTPAKASARLLAANPFIFSDTSLHGATCIGRGKARAGRYAQFQCEIEFAYRWPVLVRVLPIGSGKLCIPTTLNTDGELVTLPYKPGTAGVRVAPERACPSA